MSDLVKAKETIKNISTCTSLDECQQVIQEICNETGYFDRPKELENNDDYNQLINYLTDAQSILITPPSITADDLIEYCLKNTSTDVYTYLDNFVYDDTSYESLEQYISTDFKNTIEFRLHIIKNYFLNNFENYLNNL